MNPDLANQEDARGADKAQDFHTRLFELKKTWAEKYRDQPNLPTSALLTGAVAMACGFGAVMFFAFAWTTNFKSNYVWGTAIFATLSLSMGLLNRFFARRWYEMIKVWHAERVAVQKEMEALKKEQN